MQPNLQGTEYVTTEPPFDRSFTPQVGEAVTVADHVRLITAPNPGPMTFTGTNTYIVGSGDVAIIDPGPDDAQHLQALLTATDGARVKAILVTHSHVDHTGLARRLAAVCGASICAARRPPPKTDPMFTIAGGGEGIDHSFEPEIVLEDGDRIDGDGWSIEAIATPGHLSDHLSFSFGEVLFSGDHVMGWASTVISPPEGNLNDFMTSLDVLEARKETVFFPGHGGRVGEPKNLIRHLRTHRNGRKSSIYNVLSNIPQSIEQVTKAVYTDVDQKLHAAASRNVWAHLAQLLEENAIEMAFNEGTPVFRQKGRVK